MSAPGFLRLLGAFEFHRHAPGVLLHEQNQDKLGEDGFPFQGNFLVIDLVDFPPTISMETAEEMLRENGKTDIFQIRCGLDLSEKAGGAIFPLTVHARTGGRQDFPLGVKASVMVPRAAIEAVRGSMYYDPEDMTKIPCLTRLPARDSKGRGLPFVLDEIDAITMDARKNFRLPASNDDFASSSPKTIYDYVELIIKDREQETWLESLRIGRKALDEMVCLTVFLQAQHYILQ